MRAPSPKTWLRLAALAVLAFGGWALLRNFHFDALRDAVSDARIWPLLLGACINFGNMYCKGLAWHVLLAPAFEVRTLRLFRYTMAASAISALAPLRAGEAVRIWLLKSRDGVPVSDTMAVAVAEKLLDAASMIVMVAPLPLLLHGLPRWVDTSLAILCALSTTAAIAWVLVARFWHAQVPARFAGAVRVLRQPWRRLGGAFLALLMSWVIDLAVVLLVFYALGMAVPWAAGLLVLLCLNAAIAVPSTPGQVGAFELGATGGLALLDVPAEEAMAFAVLYHAIQILPLLGVALADSRFVLHARRDIAASTLTSH